MEINPLLDQLFPEGHQVKIEDWLAHGEAKTGGTTVSVLGTLNHTFIGGRECVALSGKLLDIAEKFPGRSVIMLVDNNGQRMGLDEELLVLPEYIAHLLKAQDLVRSQGGRLIAVLYGNSVAGGFIAMGMLADRIVSVPGGDTAVMKLEAISRVTHVPLEQLQDLAKKNPVFAPGCENLHKMGGLYEIWTDRFAERLVPLLTADISRDVRAQSGFERNGRMSAIKIIDQLCAD